MSKYCTLIFALFFALYAEAQTGTAEPNCQDLNVYLDANGDARFRVREFLTNAASGASSAEITITTTYGAVVYGPTVRSTNQTIVLPACAYKDLQLKINVRNQAGSCWSYLTFKQSNGPVLQGRSKEIYCFDPLIKGGHIDDEPPMAVIPCVDAVSATFVADWVTPYECLGPFDPANDTSKIIYREYEAFDKKGNRGFVFDTLIVFNLPAISVLTTENAYCAEKDTTYCGEGFAGPFMIYPERCEPDSVGVDADMDGSGCDTLYFLVYDDSMEMWVPNPVFEDYKCGISVHADKWVFDDDCQPQYKYILDIKQECVPPIQTICTVDPALAATNGMTQISEGYYRCEFWIIDLDTLPPLAYCKGEPLFVGPFKLDYWDINSGFAALPESTIISDGVDGSRLPHKLIVKSLKNDFIYKEEDIAGNGFYPYSQNFEMINDIQQDGSFDFSWKFSLGEVQDDFAMTNTVGIPNGNTSVAFYYSVDGEEYSIIQGEPIVEANGPDGTGATQALVSIDENQSGRVSIPVKAGNTLTIRAIWNSFGPAVLHIFGETIVSTGTHECAAHTYIPPLYAIDDWSGVKQAKAVIEDVGSFTLSYDAEDSCWVSHQQVKLYKKEGPYKVIYEAYDSCHNVGIDSCYIYVKDLVKPIPVVDKGVTVSLSDKKVWVDAKTFDEGSWDNCGVNLLLARRADWYTACIDLCDSIALACTGIHHDSLWVASLEPNKHKEDTSFIDEVEAHYAKTLDWMCADSVPCGELIYNAWQYDLMKYATLECIEHPYEVDAKYFRKHFERCYIDFYYKHGTFGPQTHTLPDIFNESEWHDIDPDGPIQLVFDRFKNMPNTRGHDIKRYRKSASTLKAEVDLYEQIGGGWSDAVPFSCEDACGPVTVEILVMDYWCNWAKAWTKVWVEDKTPLIVAKDVVPEETISCKSYKDKRYDYPDEIHPVNLEYIVAQAKAGEQDAYDLLDEVFGGYEKAWMDPYGNYVDNSGEEIDCEITFYDSVCECSSYVEKFRVYDEHLGYIWKDSLVTLCEYEEDEIDLQHGVVVVNCEENVYCEQEVWCEFDHCGQGYLFRKFKIWQGCPDSFFVEHDVPDSLRHPVDTIYRHQRIWVGNECPLNKYMFNVPADDSVHTCDIQYDAAGNVIGDAGPENTGYATYKFDDDCRVVGIAHQDKVFKIVGGDAACYKIIRTWYFADWCGTGGTPVDGNWWHDYELVIDSCVQKIIVHDDILPICTIDSIPEGDTVEVSACAYDFVTTVTATDPCGLKSYYWELKEISDPENAILVDYGNGDLQGDSTTFEVSSDDLGHGTYKLKVVTVDECNNEGYCEYIFTVLSVKKPSPVCVTSITATLTPWDADGDGVADTAKAVVWAGEFDSSSEPACQDTAIEFRIEFLTGDEDDNSAAGDADSLALGCADAGSHMVRLWVVSLPSDTRDFCDVVLIVQNSPEGCGTNIAGEREPLREVGGMQEDAKEMDRTMLSSEGGKKLSGVGGRPWSQLHGSEGYVLEQNLPNPFQDETSIGFTLPEAMDADITVYDVTGRVIRSVEGSFVKGYNQVQFRKSDLNVNGIMYYRLTAGDFSATKKMILIR